MKSITLFPLVVLILGTLVPWAVEAALGAEKAGGCPSGINKVPCPSKGKPLCTTDWQCSGKLKCCMENCVMKCVKPVPLSTHAGEKPGKCPKPSGKCFMDNPPNFCWTDGQCRDKLKCCKGRCGKACVIPI